MLAPDEVPLLQAARRIHKAALISNFVDRESERPALGPNDFVPLPLLGPASEPQNVNQSRKLGRKSRYSVQIFLCFVVVLVHSEIDLMPSILCRGTKSQKGKDATPG